MFLKSIVAIGVLVSVGKTHASEFEQWIGRQTQVAQAKLLANVSPAGSRKGAIIASPSKHDPDYYYHWVRDAALVADTLLSMYEHSNSISERQQILAHVVDFVEFSRFNQATHSIAGLGEPKYHVDGSAFLGPWGRPQNDGPALRASALMRFGQVLLDNGYGNYFYGAVWPVIRNDLQYVSEVWPYANFDLWEEIKGDHFYTRLVQRNALVEGASFAARVGDQGFAAWLALQGELVTDKLNQHFSAQQKTIVENINRVDGIWYKDSGLDTATLLAVLHTKRLPWLPFSNEYLLNTAHAIEESFAQLYEINARRRDLGTAIGRYPEDQYYGGNPWILTTLAFAEFNYELGAENSKAGRKIEANKYLAQGDAYLARVRYHLDAHGSMSEQLRRDSGYMTSAHDLTWSYSAWLTAVWSRENLASIVSQ